jgi:hypothetical protein
VIFKYADDQGTPWGVPQDRLWDWLKAERKHNDAERQRERQAGVPELVLANRRQGKPEAPRSTNRAARRAFQRSLKRI